MLQEQGEENSQEGGCQHAAVFYPALDVEGLGHPAFILHCRLHEVMKWPDHATVFNRMLSPSLLTKSRAFVSVDQ